MYYVYCAVRAEYLYVI